MNEEILLNDCYIYKEYMQNIQELILTDLQRMTNGEAVTFENSCLIGRFEVKDNYNNYIPLFAKCHHCQCIYRNIIEKTRYDLIVNDNSLCENCYIYLFNTSALNYEL